MYVLSYIGMCHTYSSCECLQSKSIHICVCTYLSVSTHVSQMSKWYFMIAEENII